MSHDTLCQTPFIVKTLQFGAVIPFIYKSRLISALMAHDHIQALQCGVHSDFLDKL